MHWHKAFECDAVVLFVDMDHEEVMGFMHYGIWSCIMWWRGLSNVSLADKYGGQILSC